jgi:hypothetical protein
MKKKFKKLSLSTETLRTLSNSNLKEAAGAFTTFVDPFSKIETKCNTMFCTFCTAVCSECTRPCTVCCVP